MNTYGIVLAFVGCAAVVLPFIFDRKPGVGLWVGGWDIRNYLSPIGVVVVAAGAIIHTIGWTMIWLSVLP